MIYRLQITEIGYHKLLDLAEKPGHQRGVKAFLVRAPNEKEARKFAGKNCGVEGGSFWRSTKYVECQLYDHEGCKEVFLKEFI